MGRSRSRERHRHSHSRSRSRSRSRDKQQHSEGRRDSGRDTSRDRSQQRQPLRRPAAQSRSRSRDRDRDNARRGNSTRSRSRSRSRSLPRAAPVAAAALRGSSRDGLHREHGGRGNSSPVGERRREIVRRSRSRSRSRQRRSRSRSRERRRGGSRSPPAALRRGSRDSRDRERDRGRDRDRDRDRADGEGQRHGSRWEQQQQQFPPPPQQQQQQFPPPPGGGAAAAAAFAAAAVAAAAAVDRDRGHDRDRDRQWDRDGGGGVPRRPPAGPVSDEPPPIGSIHRGVVHTVKPFGVFVAIEGYRRHVLVHHSQVSEEVLLTRGDEDELKVKALEYAAPPGQRVWVKILEVSADQNQNGPGYRVHGSMRVVDQDSGADLDPTGQAAAAAAKGGGGGRQSDEPPEVGTCHRGEVKRIEAYGVFVALQGFRKYGLVHASQVANYLEFSAEDGEAERKKAIGEVVELGQEVWVKVVEVGHDDRGPKIGCSMKLVDQADGTDLDPQNLRYRPRGEGGQGGPGGRAPVGANAGEVRGGAIDWGYLATRPDAFGSTGYDLLQDDPEEPGRPAAGGRGGGFPPPPQQQQQQQQQQQHMPPVGRGRGAVVPAWMAQGPAAPGSVPHRDAGGSDAAAANLTVEEALRIVQAATAGKKKHKEKHKKHKKSSKHKHKKSSRKRSRSRSRGRSSSSDSESDRGR
uniref:S1 motif domain-containing protein n=1 Tax=Tetradesmus obliquus TaxID=3088 RepID=A0A383W4N8_TETOB|eukprot:jgi/Sobl393_1/17291/SZX72180.1